MPRPPSPASPPASFETLLVARLVQGLANAAPRVVAIAVVRDVYGGRRMAEVMSFVMMVFIVVPVLAPSVGGLFLVVGSWHLIFACLFVDRARWSLVWMALRLPETRPPGAARAAVGRLAGAPPSARRSATARRWAIRWRPA